MVASIEASGGLNISRPSGTLLGMHLTAQRFRIPDRIFWILAVVVLTVTVVFLVVAYPLLPPHFPGHLGPDGQVDRWTDRTWWSVFFPSFMQAIAILGLGWLYRHPRFSNIPGSALIDLAPEPIRGILFRVLRHLIVMTVVMLNLIFAYIALLMVATAFGIDRPVNAWILGSLIGLMICITIVYTIWLYRIARSARIQLANQHSLSTHHG